MLINIFNNFLCLEIFYFGDFPILEFSVTSQQQESRTGFLSFWENYEVSNTCWAGCGYERAALWTEWSWRLVPVFKKPVDLMARPDRPFRENGTTHHWTPSTPPHTSALSSIVRSIARSIEPLIPKRHKKKKRNKKKQKSRDSEVV